VLRRTRREMLPVVRPQSCRRLSALTLLALHSAHCLHCSLLTTNIALPRLHCTDTALNSTRSIDRTQLFLMRCVRRKQAAHLATRATRPPQRHLSSDCPQQSAHCLPLFARTALSLSLSLSLSSPIPTHKRLSLDSTQRSSHSSPPDNCPQLEAPFLSGASSQARQFCSTISPSQLVANERSGSVPYWPTSLLAPPTHTAQSVCVLSCGPALSCEPALSCTTV